MSELIDRTWLLRPVPLIGVQGAQRFHDELVPCLEATSKRYMALRFISLPEGHKYPPMKGPEAHRATDESGPSGLLKTRWMDKWCFRLPAVILVVVDLADIFRRNRPATTRENNVALQVEAVRRSFAGRDVKMALLLVHDEPGAFVADDFVQGIRKRVQIENRCVAWRGRSLSLSLSSSLLGTGAARSARSSTGATRDVAGQCAVCAHVSSRALSTLALAFARYIKVLYASDLSPTSSALVQLEKSVQTLAEAFYKLMYVECTLCNCSFVWFRSFLYSRFALHPQVQAAA